MRYLRKLYKELKPYLDPPQLRLVVKAYAIAFEAHRLQKRHSGEPYITHPVAVATILAKMHLDYQTIIAALLHDVLEDTSVRKEEIARDFGEEVAELVDGVSKLTQIEFETRAHAQAENFRKMIMAMANDIRVILVKLADRLHNMRTLGSLPREKLRRICDETLEIYAPIANRLGMHTFRVEYEELSFAALYPNRYNVLKKAVKKATGNRKEVVAQIEKNIHKRLRHSHLGPVDLSGREKQIYSIYEKMRSKHLSFSEIMDIYGFRVIVDSVDMCYRVLGALHNLYKPLPERFKDYIALPKANGYQSLHTTLFGPHGVPLEIQIRTQVMDHTAETGIAAHWLYKSQENSVNDAQLRAREWVKSILELQQQSAGNSLEFIEHVKIDLFPNEVYVFTPQGRILELPAKSTPIDFAYAVHSAIGDTCIAAKVDRRLVSLHTQLKNGQTIEIITAPDAKPNASWLNFVRTGKAKSAIRHFVKSQRRSESIELGKRLIAKALGHSFPEDDMMTIAQQFNLVCVNDLLEEVGLGTRTASLVVQQLHQLQHPDMKLSDHPLKPLVIRGTEGVVLHYASCCQPIIGDEIVGMIRPGHGIDVHRTQCTALQAMQQAHNNDWIALSWHTDVELSLPAKILLDAEESKPGMLARITMALGEKHANIKHIEATESGASHCQVTLIILVKNTEHLTEVLQRLKRIDGVLGALRF